MLISLDQIKTYLGLDGATITGSTALLTMFEEFVVSEVSDFIGKNIEEAAYTNEVLIFKGDRFDLQEPYIADFDLAWQRPIAFTKNYPIATSGGLQLAVTYLGNTLVNDTDYTCDPENGTITFYRWVSDWKNRLKATYTAGYNAATLPAGLQMVILDGIKLMYQNSGITTQNSANVTSKRVGDFGVSFGSDANSTVTYSKGDINLKKYLADSLPILKRYMSIEI